MNAKLPLPARCGALALALVLATTASTADPYTAAGAMSLEARPFFFALSVRDVEASAAWYARVFGFESARAVDLEARGIRVRLLRLEDALLELVEVADARSPTEFEPGLEGRHLIRGVFKIGFEVADLGRALARLEALGIATRGEPVTEADGSLRSVQVEDPDGNVVQIFERLE